MSAAPRIYKPNGNRRPNPNILRSFAEELESMEPDEHISDHPKFKGLRYVGLSTYARDQLVQKLRECADWIDNPTDVPLMVKLGDRGFRSR